MKGKCSISLFSPSNKVVFLSTKKTRILIDKKEKEIPFIYLVIHNVFVHSLLVTLDIFL